MPRAHANRSADRICGPYASRLCRTEQNRVEHSEQRPIQVVRSLTTETRATRAHPRDTKANHMTDAPNRCVNRCTRRAYGGASDPEPVLVDPPARLCNPCRNRLHEWLDELTYRYALLNAYRLPGSTIDENPDRRRTTRTTGAAPGRLDVVDLLDTRRILTNTHDRPAYGDDRRGALGVIAPHAARVRDQRGIDPPDRPTIATEAHTLARNLTWLTGQEWIGDVYADTQRLHRDLSAAAGEYRQRPVGACPVQLDDGPCGGPLLPDDYGVRCPACTTRWTTTDLRRLGLVLSA